MDGYISTKEVFTILSLVKEKLDKGEIELTQAILNEKVKRVGMKHSTEMMMMTVPTIN